MLSSTVSLASKPSLIEKNNLRFLIMDCPKPTNLHLYLRECEKNNVSDIVRICEPSYDGQEVQNAGISLHEMQFEDGASPPDNIIDSWLALVDANKSKNDDSCIAVHCVAGLGRAPVLVAIALIESGLDPIKAVALIREKRRGAINSTQLNYLQEYQRRSKSGCGCIIS